MNTDPKNNRNQNNKNNGPSNDPDNSKRTKTIITMVVVALVFTVIINLVYTSLSSSYMQKITYSEFEEMLANNEIAEVEFQTDDSILILTKEEAAKDVNKQIIYYTGLIPNQETTPLTEDLKAHGVSYDGPIVEEMNPILSFVVSWVLPLAIFYLLITLVMNSMTKRMGGGGGIGGMGQSTAKV